MPDRYRTQLPLCWLACRTLGSHTTETDVCVFGRLTNIPERATDVNVYNFSKRSTPTAQPEAGVNFTMSQPQPQQQRRFLFVHIIVEGGGSQTRAAGTRAKKHTHGKEEEVGLCRQKGSRLRIFSECFDGWKIKGGKEEEEAEEEEEEKAFSTGSNGRSQPFASVPVCVDVWVRPYRIMDGSSSSTRPDCTQHTPCDSYRRKNPLPFHSGNNNNNNIARI